MQEIVDGFIWCHTMPIILHFNHVTRVLHVPSIILSGKMCAEGYLDNDRFRIGIIAIRYKFSHYRADFVIQFDPELINRETRNAQSVRSDRPSFSWRAELCHRTNSLSTPIE